MPVAVQQCTGASRLVPVQRFRDDDRVDCPGCAQRPKSKRRVERSDLYYEVPPHRPVGERDKSKIDWSAV